jgi:hypothetical protein
MIYLKEYNTFDSLYHQISYADRDSILDLMEDATTDESFTEEELEYFKDYRFHMVVSFPGYINIFVNSNKVGINKKSDEYYYVIFFAGALNEYIYFKCDTFEGLKQLIEVLKLR